MHGLLPFAPFPVQEKLGAEAELTISTRQQLSDIVVSLRESAGQALDNAEIFHVQEQYQVCQGGEHVQEQYQARKGGRVWWYGEKGGCVGVWRSRPARGLASQALDNTGFLRVQEQYQVGKGAVDQ